MKDTLLKTEDDIHKQTEILLKKINNILIEHKELIQALLLKYSYYKSDTKSEIKAKLNKVLSNEESEGLLWMLTDTLNYINSLLSREKIKSDTEKLTSLWQRLKKTAYLTHKVSLDVELILLMLKLSLKIKNELLNHFIYIENEVIEKIYNKYGLEFNKSELDSVLFEKWLDSNFLVRIDKQTNKLTKNINSLFEQYLYTGVGLSLMKYHINNLIDSEFNYYKGLSYTESSYVYNKLNRDVFINNFMTLGRLEATLDSRTSKICRFKNGTIVDLTTAKMGVDLPPFHPNCRTIVVPLLNE